MVKTKKKAAEQKLDQEELKEKNIRELVQQQLLEVVGKPPRSARTTLTFIPGLRACRVNIWEKVENKEQNILHPYVDKLTTSYWLELSPNGKILHSNPEMTKKFLPEVRRGVEDTD